MKREKTKILLVEDNPGDARLIREMLHEEAKSAFEIEWVSRLSEGLAKLAHSEVDLVLLDLGLPDSHGLETFVQAYAHAPEVPFVVLTGLDDETIALTAVRNGAQDFLIKSQTDGSLLLRAIRYATERKKIEEELRQEIEERQAAELALEAERRRLFALLDGLPAMVHLKASDFSIRFANRIFREIFGDWEGKRCFEVVQGGSEPCNLCPSREVFETGKQNESEWTAPYRRQTFQIYNYPFFDINGSPQVLTLGFDITQRKQTEEDLRQSEARVAKASRLAHLGYWEWDLGTGEIIWSDEVYRIFGLSPGEFALSLEGAMKYIHPDDEGRVRSSLNDALAGARPFNLVSRIIRPDGAIRYVHSQAEVFDGSGQSRRMVGTAQDITLRRTAEMRLQESEARLRAIYDNAAMGIILTDLEGRIMTTNSAFLRLLNYSEEELRSKSFVEITHPDDLGHNLELFHEVTGGTRDGYQLEKRYLRRDGSPVWVRVTASVVRGPKGEPLYATAMVEDITARKEAREKLRESERNLRFLATRLLTAQEDERKRISRELHDELGQSLLVLKLQLQAMQRHLVPGDQPVKEGFAEALTYLDKVVDNARRLSRDLSPGILEDLGLGTALNRLVCEFEKHYQMAKCHTEIDDIDDCFGSEARINIYRIVQESLTNIGKYSRADHVAVVAKRERDKVSFSVADNGCGFDMALVLGGDADGRGLGLAAMEERVRLLGGILEIWSRPGQGTRISFTVPPDRKAAPWTLRSN